ncbi:MAG: hypothetical protein KatS3mg109_0186 [Pirellulaceae bacterium]|jgi:hypothetical protein|nr:MAG: hypothetical protein KatS3mg109_0186 [Pirellulaceae bacterium]
MAKVMVSLLGGRPVPNMLAILHLKPDNLYVVVSEDSLRTGGNYEKLVNALPNRLRPSQPCPVKPYILKETSQQCRTIANQHPSDQIIIVSASEPKTMGFGAYDVVKDLREQGRDVDMCYLSREGLVWVFQDVNNVESVRIGLKDYFVSYGWDVTSKAEPDERFQKLVELLIGKLPISHRLLCILRSNDKGKGKRTIRCKTRLNDDEFSVLQEIEQLQIVSGIQQTNTETRWTINSDEEAKFLLTGDWLEFYIYQIASQLKTSQGAPLFDECGWGVEDTLGKGEIDFAGIFGGQMIIASCKTEDSIRRTWFEELHSKMEQLGKGMCSALMVSSVSRSSRTDKDLADYEKWARERQIVLVMAEDLTRLPDIFRKVVAGDENAEPKHIPCYARI